MELATTVAEARTMRRLASGRTTALVPTMGFLHNGHLALVRRAAELAEEVWVSIFVNPTQFGPEEDFDRYPRDLARDLELLDGHGVTAVFAPEVAEMYPRPPAVEIRFPGLEEVMCGAERPGHFAGVGLVVSKLLHIVGPDLAVFGQKDAQQALLIRRLAVDLDFPVRIEVVPTVREADGLAMSSRNAYLSPAGRRRAPVVYRALGHGREAIRAGETDPERVVATIRETVATEPEVDLEYAVCVAEDDLKQPESVDRPVLLAVAARVEGTRLIDNLPVTPPSVGAGA